MQWNQIIGHTENLTRLKAMLSSGRIPHALLLAGPDGIGKTLVAYTLAANLLCKAHSAKPCGICQSCRHIERHSHPDLLVIRPDGATIKIEQIRKLQQEVALAPHFGSVRVCIMEDAERMTAQAANSLLKTLEEPSGNLIFILVSSARQLLLETIISRCLVLNFQSLPYTLVAEALVNKGFLADQATVAARLAGGRMGRALGFLEPEGMAARNQAAECVAGLLSGGMKFVWDAALRFDKMERQELLELLGYFGMILRDLLMIVSGQDKRLLFNLDLVERLNEQAGSWDETRLIAAIGEVTKCRQALKANANPRLASEALLIKLRELAQGG